MIVSLLTALVAHVVSAAKDAAAFFLSGGGVVFTAVLAFVHACIYLYNLINEHSQVLVGWIGQLSGYLNEFSNLPQSGLSQLIIHATAMDTLASQAVTYVGLIGSFAVVVSIGIFSGLIAVIFPILVFRVVYFVKSQIKSAS